MYLSIECTCVPKASFAIFHPNVSSEETEIQENQVEDGNMGADFPKLRGCSGLRYKLSRQTTKSRHQKHNKLTEWNYSVFTRVCRSSVPGNSMVKKNWPQLNGLHYDKKCGGVKRY